MFLRRLNPDSDADRGIASELFLSNPDYELQHFGRLPSHDMAEPLWQRFPEECAPEHRLTLMAFDHDKAIGLVQIALHAPTPDCAALLLMMVSRPFQQQHIGCEIIERLSKQARRWPGISNWYVTVMDSNDRALAFWRHCGFRTRTQGLVCEGFAESVTLLTRPVKARPACQHSRAPESAGQFNSVKLFARLP